VDKTSFTHCCLSILHPERVYFSFKHRGRLWITWSSW